MKEQVDKKDSVLQSGNPNLSDKNYELNETIGENIIDFIKNLGFEQKETTKFKQITKQGESNYTLYIVEKGSKLKLIKNGKESVIELPVDSVIGESTFLQYLKGEKITKANASVEIQGKYLQVSFEKFKKELNSLSERQWDKVVNYFIELENQRKNKTTQVHPK